MLSLCECCSLSGKMALGPSHSLVLPTSTSLSHWDTFPDPVAWALSFLASQGQSSRNAVTLMTQLAGGST